MNEIRAFLGGGMAALARLKEILPSLFSYFQIITLDSRAKLLIKCGLTPIHEDNASEITFYFNPSPEKGDPLQPGRSVSVYKPSCTPADPMTITLEEETPLEPHEHEESPFSAQMQANTRALPSPA